MQLIAGGPEPLRVDDRLWPQALQVLLPDLLQDCRGLTRLHGVVGGPIDLGHALEVPTEVTADVRAAYAMQAAVLMLWLPGQQGLELHRRGHVELAPLLRGPLLRAK